MCIDMKISCCGWFAEVHLGGIKGTGWTRGGEGLEVRFLLETDINVKPTQRTT